MARVILLLCPLVGLIGCDQGETGGARRVSAVRDETSAAGTDPHAATRAPRAIATH